MNAIEAIRKEYGEAKNFMTPYVEDIGWISPGRVAYELSSGGRLFGDGRMYGVSLVRVTGDKTERLHKRSGAFDSRDAATGYIRRLQRACDAYREACSECGNAFDDNPGAAMCRTCQDWI